MNKVKFIVSLIVLSISLLSCSDKETKILSTSATIVFEYADETSAPDVSLAVFLQTDHQVQKTDSFTVKEKSGDFKWIIQNPVMISNSSKQWAGYTQLRAAGGQKFSSGMYDVIYVDAAGEEFESHFVLNYSQNLYKSNKNNFAKEVKSSLIESRALYDKDLNLLYYGANKSSWKKNSVILHDYNRAVFSRKIMSTGDSMLMFRMPLEKLSED